MVGVISYLGRKKTLQKTRVGILLILQRENLSLSGNCNGNSHLQANKSIIMELPLKKRQTEAGEGGPRASGSRCSLTW